MLKKSPLKTVLYNIRFFNIIFWCKERKIVSVILNLGSCSRKTSPRLIVGSYTEEDVNLHHALIIEFLYFRMCFSI